ncbi:MAG: FAD-binding protein, partial [Marmoricola sp.]
FGIVDKWDLRVGLRRYASVVKDAEVRVDRREEFRAWFDELVGMRPVWLCPLRLREGPDGARTWPSYPLAKATTYINVGFWGTVHVGDAAHEAPTNRAIEKKVHELGGHKSLYSEAFYDPATFHELYDGTNLAEVKRRYDPDNRLSTLYDKAVGRR